MRWKITKENHICVWTHLMELP